MSRFVRRNRLSHIPVVVRKDEIGNIVKARDLVAENSRRIIEYLTYDPNDAGYRLRAELSRQRGYN